MTIIRVIDLETTGLELPGAEVCEVGTCDIYLEEKRVSLPIRWFCYVSSIPPEARAVHGIFLEDCDECEKFDPDRILSGDVNAIASHNSDFDTKFFTPNVPVICTYKSALRVWPDAPAHNIGTLRYWLEDQGKIEPKRSVASPSHRAGPDAYVTAHVLLAMFNEGITGREMVAWTKEPRLFPRCPIGKFKGLPWSDVEPGFLGWMLRQPDMEHDLKWNAQHEISRRQQS